MAILASVYQNGTIGLEATLQDTDGNDVDAANIDSIEWWLYKHGEIVNGRDGVSVSPVENPATIVLSGDDLPAGIVTLLVKWVYDSTIKTEAPHYEQTEISVLNTPK